MPTTDGADRHGNCRGECAVPAPSQSDNIRLILPNRTDPRSKCPHRHRNCPTSESSRTKGDFKMKNGFTTAVTAIALALGGFSAQPVGAGGDSRDLAKFLLFSSLLVAIAADRNRKDTPPAAVAHPKPHRKPHVHAPAAHPPPSRYRPRRHVCLEDFWNGRRWVTFRDHECRRHNSNGRGFRGVNRCLRDEFRRGRWVSTFDRHCMHRKGFTLARGH